MKAEKAKKLAKAGWKIGNATEFVELDRSEAEFVDMKLGLAQRPRELREQHKRNHSPAR